MIVKMPHEQRQQVQPPTADHVDAVVRLLPSCYRLATLVLDATGMRVGELEQLTWGDLDEPRARWRIATSKTGQPRWVTPPPLLLERVLELCPRDDRHPDRRVFEQVTGDRATNGTHACLHRSRCARVLTAWPSAEACQPDAPGRGAMGQDRRAGRPR
jgi:integrase